MTEKIYFAKVKPDAIIPSKKDFDAGYDIYANFPEEQIIIEPFTSKLIPTGIASTFSSCYVALLEERGSTGVKNLKRSAGVIDSSFRGEWFVCLYNANNKPLIITKEINKSTLDALSNDYIVYPYTKGICQMLLIEVPKITVEEIDYENLLSIESSRGLGCIGSSGK